MGLNVYPEPATGDVVGPASSTDNAIVRFDSTTGKLLQNSGVTVSDANVIAATGLNITPASASGATSVAFYEDTDNGSHAVTLKAPAAVTANVDVTLPDAACNLGYLNIPQQSFSAAYPIVAADAGKHLYHPVGDANARQVTIPANGSVPFELGTAITIVNDSPNNVTVVITTDVLAYANVGTITTLTIPQYNQATILKVLSTRWVASGTAGCTTA